VTATTADLVTRLAAWFEPLVLDRLGVAVSGGGDSVALLCLLADWAAEGGPAIEAVTVDHGLRPESAGEAKGVAQLCGDLGIRHTTLRWQGWDGRGNLADQARRTRYRLMSDWAVERGLQAVALGHTQDDVAEGFVMRLTRGAGLDGLSAMADRRVIQNGVTLLRPLLQCSRAELREDLKRRGQIWVDDPSNDDDRFERARIRNALAVLEDYDLDPQRIAESAGYLREARDELSLYVKASARQELRFDAGDVLIPLSLQRDDDMKERLIVDRPETFRRVLQAGLIWISGRSYPVRREALQRLIDARTTRTGITLAGCRAVFQRTTLRLTREWKAVADAQCGVGALWDGRWQLTGPDEKGLRIAALGEAGLRYCPDRKSTGRPAASLIASPAVWRGDELVAAPLAGLSNGWSAQLIRGESYFFSVL